MQGTAPTMPTSLTWSVNLDGVGKLTEFESAFEALAGKTWRDRRKAYHFSRDHVVQALGQVTGQSVESCVKWIDNAKDHFT